MWAWIPARRSRLQGDADGQLQCEEGPVNRLDLTVEGIKCSGCALDIETVLRNEEGVLEANVDYSACRISIQYDEAETNEDRIYGALNRIGLKVLKRR